MAVVIPYPTPASWRRSRHFVALESRLAAGDRGFPRDAELPGHAVHELDPGSRAGSRITAGAGTGTRPLPLQVPKAEAAKPENVP